MEFCKKDIHDYYSDLTNQIDINTELIISRCKSASNLNHNLIDELNFERENFLKQIKKCQTENLKNLNYPFQGLFCFYIKSKNLFQTLSIGKLVVVRKKIPENVIRGLSGEIDACVKFNEKFLIEAFKKLIQIAQTNLIDLTENNHVNQLEVVYCLKSIEKNPLDDIETFIDLKSLKKLDLVINRCDIIESSLFTKINNIETLNIECRSLKYLQENNFKCLKLLKKLKIKSYQYFEIEQNALYGLESLENLDLSKNYLYLDSALQLNGLDCLKILNISFNNMNTLCVKPFYYLNTLKVLDLSDHNIESIEQGDLDGLDSIEELYLKNYPVYSQFKQIEIKNNSLKSSLKVLNIQSEHIKLSPGCLKNLKNLLYLNIKGVKVKELSTLRLPSSLEFLEITPKFNVFSDYDKIDLPNLKYLSFGCNRFSKFNFKNLQALNINDLFEIENGAFENQNNLDYLKLTFVNDSIIYELDKKIFNGLSNRFRFFQMNFYRPLSCSLEKLKSIKSFFHFLFDQACNNLKIDVEYSTVTEILSLTAKNVESEEFYFENVLNVSEQVKNAFEKQLYYDEYFLNLYS